MAVFNGGGGNDPYPGTGDNDDIFGNAGDDSLSGAGGSDIIYGDESGDMGLPGGADTLDGGDGNDLLAGGRGNDRLSGGAGDDVIFNGLASNATRSGTGFTFGVFEIDGGDDVIDGGAGVDRAALSYRGRTAGVTLDISNAAIVSTILSGGVAAGSITGVERLSFVGGNGGDSVTGGALDDELYGYDGADTLIGGAGNDILRGDNGDDRLDGGDGVDWSYNYLATSAVTIDLNLTGPQNTGGSGTDTFISIENVWSTSFSDSVTGTAANNYFFDGGGGNDTLRTGAGNDQIIVYRSGTGAGTASTLDGGADDDFISFDGFARYVDDVTVSGGDGNDTIEAKGFRYFQLNAGSGDDTVRLDTLADTSAITLGAGADTLELLGTGGAFAGNRIHQVVDFVTGAAGDRLELTNYLGSALQNYTAGGNPFASGHLRLLQDGTNVYLQVDRNGGGDTWSSLVRFLNSTASSFTAFNLDGFNPLANNTPTSGADTLTGGAGPDTIDGLGGDDDIIGGEGNDTLSGSDGRDILRGDDGSTTTPDGADSLSGGAGDDFVEGGRGNDTLVGGDGNDILFSGIADLFPRSGTFYSYGWSAEQDGGNDSFDGGAGIDQALMFYGGRTQGVSVDISDPEIGRLITVGGTAVGSIRYVEQITFYGGSGGDTVLGGAQFDSLTGNDGADFLSGGGGNDYLTPGAGNDTVDGGSGRDYLNYYQTSSGVTIDLSVSSAQNTGGSGLETILGIEDIQGSELGADRLTGDAGNNNLYGSGGDDTLIGGGGADYLEGWTGSDSVDGGEGADTLVVYGGSGYSAMGTDTLNGGLGDDTLSLVGSSGPGFTIDLRAVGPQGSLGGGTLTLISIENVRGGQGSDTVYGTEGDNRLSDSSGGEDRLYGLGGRDTIYVGQSGTSAARTVLLDGGSGDDTLEWYSDRPTNYVDSATIFGGAGTDYVYVRGLGFGTIDAGADNDYVSYDTLGGTYTITLGLGQDSLQLNGTNGGFASGLNVVVTDFATGPSGDRLELKNWMTSALQNHLTGSNPFATGHLRLLQAGANTLLQVDRNGGGDSWSTLMTLQNTTATSFARLNLSGFNPFASSTPTAGDDALTGGAGADTLDGLAGDDDIIGGGGGDTLFGGVGADVIIGDDLSSSTPDGADLLEGGVGNDRLMGGAGADTLRGGDGDDVLFGGLASTFDRNGFSWSPTQNGGEDVLDGGSGSDYGYLFYATRTGPISLDNSNSTTINVVSEGGVAIGSIINVEGLRVALGQGNDFAVGGFGNDAFEGNSGNDTLIGGGGVDVLEGGSGDDILIGGDGFDYTYLYTGNANASVFTLSSGNLVVSGPDGTDILSGIESVSFNDLTLSTAAAPGVLAAYKQLFGRGAGGGELGYWAGLIAGGGDQGDVVAAMVNSSSAAAAAGRALVGQYYGVYLGRGPSAGEADFWAGALASGNWSLQQVQSVLRSQDGAAAREAAYIAGQYGSWFGRAPDAADTQAWTGLFASAEYSPLQFRQLLIGAGRPYVDGRTDALYQTWFGRSASAGEKDAWAGLYGNGAEYATLRGALIGEGRGFIDGRTDALYQTWFGRAASAGEKDVWYGLYRDSGAEFGTLRSALIGEDAGRAQIRAVTINKYQDFFGRAADQNEIDVWYGLFRDGLEYGNLRNALVHEPTGIARIRQVVAEGYGTYFGRAPTQNESDYWLGAIQGGVEYAQFYAVLDANNAPAMGLAVVDVWSGVDGDEDGDGGLAVGGGEGVVADEVWDAGGWAWAPPLEPGHMIVMPGDGGWLL